jgi:hypothetical protein
LKSSYFPIAAKRRGPQSDNPARLSSEQHYLLYPLGNLDDDPEKVLNFDGILPKPLKRSGHLRRRAVVTIDFFELDTREELLRGRAEKILELKLALIVSESDRPPPDQALAKWTIALLQSAKSEHSNCVRSFLRLYSQDRPRAEIIFQAVLDYLERLDHSTNLDPGAINQSPDHSQRKSE